MGRMTLTIVIRLILICLTFVSCQEGDSTGIRASRVSSGEGKRLKRLTIVSEVPTSRKRTTTQTRRVLEPEGTGKTASGLLRQSLRESIFQQQLATDRPEARGNDFEVLKQAKEGVWYRRVEDDEGVRLFRVKNND